jgi:hypothetical protein
VSLTREELLAARPLEKQEVQVPELGGTVFVRVMNGIERDAYEADIVAHKDQRLVNVRARFVVRCACDADGKLLFTPEDAEALGRTVAAPALDRLAQAGQRLNRMTDAAVEELKGKSPPSPGDAQS